MSAPKKAPETVRVRVLRDTGAHRPDEVVTLSAAEAAAAVADGWADADPTAVEYALSLKA